MTISDIALLDTNVLVYAADETSPFHHTAKRVRDRGLRGEIILAVTPQVLSEFFAVVTDTKRVLNPRTQQEAALEIEKYYRSKSILKIYPTSDLIPQLLKLLQRYPVSKQQIFDLQLVATMLCNGVTRLYTYDVHDFAQYSEIEILNIEDVAK